MPNSARHSLFLFSDKPKALLTSRIATTALLGYNNESVVSHDLLDQWTSSQPLVATSGGVRDDNWHQWISMPRIASLDSGERADATTPRLFNTALGMVRTQRSRLEAACDQP
jgi:hypothetical protein